MLDEKLLTTNITREYGKLYYLKNDENGQLCVYSSVMVRGRKKKVSHDENN